MTEPLVTRSIVAVVLLTASLNAREGFFGTPAAVFDVNSDSNDVAGPISASGLEFFFASDRPGGKGAYDIWVATRTRRDEPFGDPRPVEELNTTSFEFPWSLSVDGSTLYFDSDRGGGAGLEDIYMATREDDRFCPPERLGEGINTEQIDWEPSVTADGLEIYFMRAPDYDFASRDLFVATRQDPKAPFGAAIPVEEINSDGVLESEPGISPDGFTLFFAYGGTETIDMWMACRETRFDEETRERVPFGPPKSLGSPVNSDMIDFGGMVSPDFPASGATLFFTRRDDSNREDIFLATWHPDCNVNGMDDSVDIENGESLDLNGNEVPDDCEGLVPVFRRGDADASGELTVTDAVFSLSYLFAGGPSPACVKSADTNDDGQLDLADPVGLLGFLFLGGPAPGAPSPDCGTDPTEDELACEDYAACR